MVLGHAPGPSGLPFVGVWPQFRQAPRQYLLQCAMEHGDVCSFHLGTTRTYLVNRPDLIEEVLVHGAAHFTAVESVAGVRLSESEWAAAPAHAAKLALRRLQQHPELMNLVREEVLALDRKPALVDLPRLELTTRTVAEALRLEPPIWAVGREVRREFRLFNYLLRAGTVCLMSPWVTHRHSTWWPDAERFNPDRFAEAQERSRPRFAYYPFGAPGDAEASCWTRSVISLAELMRSQASAS